MEVSKKRSWKTRFLHCFRPVAIPDSDGEMDFDWRSQWFSEGRSRKKIFTAVKGVFSRRKTLPKTSEKTVKFSKSPRLKPFMERPRELSRTNSGRSSLLSSNSSRAPTFYSAATVSSTRTGSEKCRIPIDAKPEKPIAKKEISAERSPSAEMLVLLVCLMALVFVGRF